MVGQQNRVDGKNTGVRSFSSFLALLQLLLLLVVVVVMMMVSLGCSPAIDVFYCTCPRQISLCGVVKGTNACDLASIALVDTHFVN